MSLRKSVLLSLFGCLVALGLPWHASADVTTDQEVQYDEDGEPQEADDVADDGPGGFEVMIGGSPVGSGAGQSGGSGVPSSGSGSTGGGAIQIACLSDDGSIRNASPSQVCKAVLPKCRELKRKLTDSVRDLMSQKIWCYYNGKDCDPTKSTPTSMVGPDMDPICSVVGHKLQGCNSDRELTQQSIGRRLSCGKRPRVQAQKQGKKFSLHYDGDNGKQWIAWMRGAYPWLIRKHAADVLLGLDDNLSNVDSMLSGTKAMNQDLARINDQMRSVAAQLAPQAQTTCNDPDSNLIADCTSGALSINDPAQRACTIVKAQLLANEGALPNILVAEIMRRVQVEYDRVFAKVITFQNPTMRNLVEACGDTGCTGCTNRKKKISKTASCFFGGEFCTTDDGVVREAPASGKCKTMNTKIDVASGRTLSSFVGSLNGGQQATCNLGFAGVIEKLIRHDICGQSKIGDPSLCDRIDIPSKPANAP